ncbi:hypothetical protein DSL72_008147 [Monilinia vaccinii-corymbosi]|uniref:Uncharacterized protein n=1 Tax=Monilinia vaccinii-corymbosi TaxID=61207 RepID=A0A8A3PJ26_9HELO|nr:hypothetical protein DSL72_008147 [Monilinia vaccinii-corymbosi]
MAEYKHQAIDHRTEDLNGLALIDASKNGPEELVKSFLSTDGIDVNSTYHERSSLHWAVERGHQAIVQLLIDHGAQIGARDACGLTPPMLTCANHDSTLVEISLDQHDNPRKKDFYNQLPSILALRTENCPLQGSERMKALIEVLLNNCTNSDLEVRDRYGRTSLSLAVRIGNEDIIKLLLNREADKNCALFFAIRDENADSFKMSLKEGVNIEVRDLKGYTPLLSAVQRNHTYAVKMLLQYNADLEARDPYTIQNLSISFN